MNRDQPLFHITHLANLPSILQAGRLYADSAMRSSGIAHTRIGHEHIKQRRLSRKVPIAAQGCLGDYVPFNFCERSVMLYVIHSGSVDGYLGGQEDVIHLVTTIGRAINVGNPWAFTDRHAELGYAGYFSDLAKLDQVNWAVMPKRQWGGVGNEQVKEQRQAEFLVHQFVAWTAISQIGVRSAATAAKVQELLRTSGHQPGVLIKPSWYY